MTREQINTTIAEACGWRFTKHQNMWYAACPGDTSYGAGLRGWQHDGDGYHSKESAAKDRAPDYMNDLNAMHEAEKLLSSKDCHSGDISSLTFYESLIEKRSTADKRAKAFLITLGKLKGKAWPPIN